MRPLTGDTATPMLWAGHDDDIDGQLMLVEPYPAAPASSDPARCRCHPRCLVFFTPGDLVVPADGGFVLREHATDGRVIA